MDLYESILYFVIILSVLNIIFRILIFFGHVKLKNGKFIKLFIFICALFFEIHIFFIASVAFIPLLFVFSYKTLANLKDNSKNLENYLSFIEKLHLKVQNQQSFLQSLRQLNEESDAFMQQNTFIKERFVLFSTQKQRKRSSFQSSVEEKLSFIYENPHQTGVYLEEWLEEEKQKQFFRHKSGQLSFQAKFQAFIISAIYFALLVYQFYFVGSELTLKYFKWTLPLMLAGFYIMYRILKGFRWKV